MRFGGQLLALAMLLFPATAAAQKDDAPLPSIEIAGPVTSSPGVLARGQSFATAPVRMNGTGVLVEPVFSRRGMLRDRIEIAPAGTRVYRITIRSVEYNVARVQDAWCGETPYTLRMLFGSHVFCVVDPDDNGGADIYQGNALPVPTTFMRRAFAETPPVVAQDGEQIASQRIEYRYWGYAGQTLVIHIYYVNDAGASYIDQIRLRGEDGRPVIASTELGTFQFDRGADNESTTMTVVAQAVQADGVTQ